jgi:hypothetical protein
MAYVQISCSILFLLVNCCRRCLQSTLDFCIHLEEFIELVRHNRCVEAIGHARKYLNGPIPDQHLVEFQSAMGLLVLAQQPKKDLNNDYQVERNDRTKPYEQILCFVSLSRLYSMKLDGLD